jgi:hypothetical protein
MIDGINIGNDTHYIPNFVHYIYDLTLPNATLIVNDIVKRNISVAFMSLFTSANITTLLAEACVFVLS